MRSTTGSMPFTNRSHQTKQISQPKTAIKSPLPSTGHEEAFCDLHNHHLHRPRNRPCRALITRRRSATCTFTIFTDRAIAPTEHWSSGDVLHRAQSSSSQSAQSPLPSTGDREACSDAQQIKDHSNNHSWPLMPSSPQ